MTATRNTIVPTTSSREEPILSKASLVASTIARTKEWKKKDASSLARTGAFGSKQSPKVQQQQPKKIKKSRPGRRLYKLR